MKILNGKSQIKIIIHYDYSFFFKNYFIVVQVQVSAFTLHHSPLTAVFEERVFK